MKKNYHLFSEICISYLYELLKPRETVDTTAIYLLTVGGSKKKTRIPKKATQSHFFFITIFHHIRQKPVRRPFQTVSLRVPPYAAYSTDLAPFDYHLFASMGHALAEQLFSSHGGIKSS